MDNNAIIIIMEAGAVKDIFRKLTDILMPIEEDAAVEAVEEKQKEEVIYTEQKVVNGDSIAYAAPAPKLAVKRPQLTVHTTKVQELKVHIYVPTNFDQVTSIADDLKSGKAAVVNYEKVDFAEQRRICDFVNGVCYVMEGEARRISETMVLYVPDGVSVAEMQPLAAEK